MWNAVISRLHIVSDPVVESASIHFEDGVAGHVTRAGGYSLVLSCSEAEIAVENDGEGIAISTRREKALLLQHGTPRSP